MSAFVLVNCIIDAEPILYFLLTGDPLHRVMHTYLGATLAALAVGLFARVPLEAVVCWLNRRMSPAQARWLGCKESVALPALWIGALAGAWSHVWLDAFMHVDVRPWWPMSTENAMQGQIDMTALHALCVITGLAGLLLLVWRRIKLNFPRIATLGKWAGWLALGTLLSYLGYFYFLLATGEERVSALCSQMKPGMLVTELTTLAKRHGLGPGTPQLDAKLIYLAEVRSFGRHACRVELDNGVVTSATYNFAD